MDVVYETIKKIPGITDNEAHEVVTKLSRSNQVVTKEALETALSAQKSDIEEALTWRMVIVAGVIIGILKFWP